jgi:hypothetical protein
VVAVTGVIGRAQERHRAIPWVQGVAGVTEIVVRHRVVPREPGALRCALSTLGGGVLLILFNLVQRRKGRGKGEIEA